MLPKVNTNTTRRQISPIKARPSKINTTTTRQISPIRAGPIKPIQIPKPTQRPKTTPKTLAPIVNSTINRAKKTYIIGTPKTPPRTPPRTPPQMNKRPNSSNSPITPTWDSPPHITAIPKKNKIKHINEDNPSKRYKEAQQYFPDMEDKAWENHADLINKNVLKELHRNTYDKAKATDYNEMVASHLVGQNPARKNEEIERYDKANHDKQIENDWFFGGNSKKRSNKKRSNKKRSNKKRSNKKRSNKKRSNKKRSNKKR